MISLRHKDTRKPSRLLTFAIVLVSLLAIGCGDSQQDYVFTGTGQQPATTGNAVFQFVQAQQNPGVVPVGTTKLLFEFYSSTSADDAFLVHTAEADYDTVVTISGVPTSSRFVVVTAYGPGRVPLATLTGTTNIGAGQNNPVSLSAPTAVTFDSITVTPSPVNLVQGTQNGNTRQLSIVGNFSNGDSVTFASTSFATNADFDGFDPAIATVSDSGEVNGVSNGDTEVVVTYTVNGQSRSTTVPIEVTGGVIDQDTLTVTPSTLQLAQGNTSADLTAFFAEAGEQPVNVTGSAFLSFVLEQPVTGISVNNETGAVTVDSTAVTNSTATVLVTYDDGEGGFAEDTVEVTVGPITVLDLDVASLSGSTLRLPANSFFPLELALTLSDGNFTSIGLEGDDSNFETYDIEIESTNPTAFSMDGFVLEFSNTTGNGSVNITSNGDGASFTVQSIPVQGDTFVSVLPGTISVAVDSTASYQVVLQYDDETTQEITNIVDPDFSGSGSVEFIFSDVASTFVGLLRGEVVGTGVASADASDFHPAFSVAGNVSAGTSANVTITAAVSP